MAKDSNCDVLIIGAGMAGGCLARQLSLEQPDLRLMVIDQKTEFDWWVGESTIEVFDDCAMRVLKLGRYMESQHIVKHGLRFWFDSEQKDLPVRELSEHGRARYSTLNRGVQLDRAAFDRDLCEINRKNGVDVRLGVRVLDSDPGGSGPGIQIDAAGGHVVHTSEGPVRCHYLVDAGGRSSPLARQLDLVPGGRQHRGSVGSYWGRFEGCRSIDDLGDATWRARVDNTLRWASTNHFMYDGYWIWLIPVDHEIVSLGVTFDHRRVSLKIRNGEELVAFFRRHRCLDEILGPDGRVLDFHGLSHIARGARQYYSADRWYLAGMSGLFVDPLFSTSGAVIAFGNRLIAELISTDRAGETEKLERRLWHFDLTMRNVYRRQCGSFDRYHSFGSFDAFANWQTLRYHSVLNHEVPSQQADYRPVIERADSHGENCGCGEGVWNDGQSLGAAGDRLNDEFVTFIDVRGQYYARNRGYFHEQTERPSTQTKTTDLDFGDAVLREDLLNWECYVRYYVTRMCEIEGIPFDEDCFVTHFDPDWRSGQTLSELLATQQARRADGKPATRSPIRWDLKGPIGAQDEANAPWWCRFIGPDGQTVR